MASGKDRLRLYHFHCLAHRMMACCQQYHHLLDVHSTRTYQHARAMVPCSSIGKVLGVWNGSSTMSVPSSLLSLKSRDSSGLNSCWCCLTEKGLKNDCRYFTHHMSSWGQRKQEWKQKAKGECYGDLNRRCIHRATISNGPEAICGGRTVKADWWKDQPEPCRKTSQCHCNHRHQSGTKTNESIFQLTMITSCAFCLSMTCQRTKTDNNNACKSDWFNHTSRRVFN